MAAKKTGVTKTPKKSKERKRKEKMVKERNAQRERDNSLIYVQVFDGGRRYETHSSVKMGARKPWTKPHPGEIRAAIPGKVMQILVHEGDRVERGQSLIEYEAMKMYNTLCTPFSGVVEQVLVKPGDKLPKGALMMVIRIDESAQTNNPELQDSGFDEYA